MKYSTRIAVAALVSILVNVAIWEVVARVVLATPVQAPAPEVVPPLVFTLAPPPPPPEPEPPAEPETPRQIIETVRESSEPIEETDLISDKNSKASDLTDSEGDRPAPSVDEPSEFDQQGAIPSEMAGAEPSPPVENPPTEEVQATSDTTPAPIEPEVEKPDVQESADKRDAAEDPAVLLGALAERAKEPEEDLPKAKPEQEKLTEEPKQESLPEPFVLAQANEPKLKFQQDMEISKGREGGGAEGNGFMSFEANKHEMGAYMLEVRTRVLRHWKAGLLLKYHGVRRTQAVIECSIRPNGELEYVRIKVPGPSYAFAVLCQEAIRKAAPFPPFPFDVPEMYRNENLEITWNFSYL